MAACIGRTTKEHFASGLITLEITVGGLRDWQGPCEPSMLITLVILKKQKNALTESSLI